MYAFSTRDHEAGREEREEITSSLSRSVPRSRIVAKIQAERKKNPSRIRGTSGNRSLKTQFEHERMRKQKRQKETSLLPPLFRTKLDPSQISPTDRTFGSSVP